MKKEIIENPEENGYDIVSDISDVLEKGVVHTGTQFDEIDTRVKDIKELKDALDKENIKVTNIGETEDYYRGFYDGIRAAADLIKRGE